MRQLFQCVMPRHDEQIAGERLVQYRDRAAGERLRVLGCPVSFGRDANALVLDRDFLERLVPTADPRLYRILKRQADHILSQVPPEDDLPGAVRRAIAEGTP